MDPDILFDQLTKQDAIEWIGLITGVIYVVLATYGRPSCWIFGIISSAAIGWKSFVDYKLIADGILQIFYIVMGLIGLWNWIQGRVDGLEKPVTTSAIPIHSLAIVICLIASIPISMLLIHFAQARYGYPDTAITLLSIWATILLIKKDLHNWLYWIILDAALVVIYYVSGAYLFSLLFIVYTGIAIYGYLRWQKLHGVVS